VFLTKKMEDIQHMRVSLMRFVAIRRQLAADSAVALSLCPHRISYGGTFSE
jgi:hypothetical protein